MYVAEEPKDPPQTDPPKSAWIKKRGVNKRPAPETGQNKTRDNLESQAAPKIKEKNRCPKKLCCLSKSLADLLKINGS